MSQQDRLSEETLASYEHISPEHPLNDSTDMNVSSQNGHAPSGMSSIAPVHSSPRTVVAQHIPSRSQSAEVVKSGSQQLINQAGSGPIQEQDQRQEQDTHFHEVKPEQGLVLESFKKGWEEDLKKNEEEVVEFLEKDNDPLLTQPQQFSLEASFQEPIEPAATLGVSRTTSNQLREHHSQAHEFSIDNDPLLSQPLEPLEVETMELTSERIELDSEKFQVQEQAVQVESPGIKLIASALATIVEEPLEVEPIQAGTVSQGGVISNSKELEQNRANQSNLQHRSRSEEVLDPSIQKLLLNLVPEQPAVQNQSVEVIIDRLHEGKVPASPQHAPEKQPKSEELFSESKSKRDEPQSGEQPRDEKKSQEPKQSQYYQVQVTPCQNQSENMLKKDNDIYGIEKKQESAKQGSIEEKLEVQSRKSEKSFNPADVEVYFENNKSPTKSEILKVQTIEQVISQMVNIKEAMSSGKQKFTMIREYLKDHIDFRSYEYLSSIGQKLLQDGQLVTLLIHILILVDEGNQDLQRLLLKYLVYKLSPGVAYNNHKFEQLRQVVEAQERQAQHQSQRAHSPSEEPNVPSIVAVQGSQVESSAPSEINLSSQKELPIKRIKPITDLRGYNPTPTRSRKTTVKKKPGNSLTQVKSKKSETQGHNQTGTKPKNFHHTLKDLYKVDDALGYKYEWRLSKNPRTKQQCLSQVRVSARLRNKALRNQQRSSESQSQEAESIHSPQRSQSPKNKSPRRSSQKSSREKSAGRQKSADRRRESEHMVDLDYVREHLDEIEVRHIMLEEDFLPQTQQDQQIYELIHGISELSQQESELQRDEDEFQMAQSEDGADQATITHQISQIREIREEVQSKKQSLKQQLQQIKQTPTTTVKRVIDPDINGHHNYALLELSTLSQIYHKAKYTLTPTANLQFARKKHIEEDLKKVREMLGEQFENIAYTTANSAIMELIRKEKEKRQAE